jgi:hypothetical protein
MTFGNSNWKNYDGTKKMVQAVQSHNGLHCEAVTQNGNEKKIG